MPEQLWLQSWLHMNAFNRILVIILLMMLLVAGAVTLISPAFALGLMRATADSVRANFFAGFTDAGRVITRVILALAWVGFLALLIWAEVRRPGSRTIEVSRYTGGSAIRISTVAVAEKIQEAVSAVGGIIAVKVNATGRNRAVEIKLDVAATKDTDLVQKAEEIATLTRQVVQDQLGLKLVGKPEVAIKAKQGKALTMKPVARNVPPLETETDVPEPYVETPLTPQEHQASLPAPTQPTQPTQP